jgi:hypothetical protein
MSEAGQIAADVVDARGILARWTTPLTLVDVFDMAALLRIYYQQEAPTLYRERHTLEALGLWPGRVELDIVRQTAGTAALYVSEEAQIYLRSDWIGDPDITRLQLAYGYARALVDQHSDLLHLIQDASTLDQRLTLMAVSRGDALFALWRYANAAPDSQRASALTQLIAEATLPSWSVTGSAVSYDPMLAQEITHLPLHLGVDFARARYAAGRLDALDEALRRPPRSTEQLLHPQRYAEGDEPLLLEPTIPMDAPGWALTHAETVGEALMGLTLSRWSTGETGPKFVEDWGGDLLQRWEGPDQTQVVLWHTVWDSAQSAGRFYVAMRALLPQHVGGQRLPGTTTPPALLGGQWRVSEHGTTYIRRYTNHVWIVWGVDTAMVETLATTFSAGLPTPRLFPPDHRSLILEP